MDELRAVGKNVKGSCFQRKELRHEIVGLMMKLGLPAFFITINPADYNHPLVLHFAGKKINLDAPFEKNWLNARKTVEVGGRQSGSSSKVL